jgi:hypothetical protein
LTSKRSRRIDRNVRNARQSIDQTRQAVREVAGDGTLDIDPASDLFFQFAAPLLATARSDHEFAIAAELAEFIWSATHFDAMTQVTLLNDFIEQTQVPDNMISWLLDVYGELAARKMALVGE